MKKILLACNMGMSTSLLVVNMQKYAESQNIDLEIKALPISEAEMEILNWDVVMVGPQIRYKIKALNDASNGKVPVCLIDMRDYGTMNGENVVKSALEALKQ